VGTTQASGTETARASGIILRQAQDQVERFQRFIPHGELVEPWATSLFRKRRAGIFSTNWLEHCPLAAAERRVSGAAEHPDFFLSRTGADKDAAGLIADIIREAGLTPFYQDEHFGHADFMRRMEQGYECSKLIALLSADYQKSEHCRVEYNHHLGKDPANLKGRLVVLRITSCQPEGSLQNLAYTDLVPVLNDFAALRRVIRVALGIDQRPTEAAFVQAYQRAGQQIPTRTSAR
jgi:TIR domain